MANVAPSKVSDEAMDSAKDAWGAALGDLLGAFEGDEGEGELGEDDGEEEVGEEGELELGVTDVGGGTGQRQKCVV